MRASGRETFCLAYLAGRFIPTTRSIASTHYRYQYRAKRANVRFVATTRGRAFLPRYRGETTADRTGALLAQACRY